MKRNKKEIKEKKQRASYVEKQAEDIILNDYQEKLGLRAKYGTINTRSEWYKAYKKRDKHTERQKAKQEIEEEK